MRFSGWYHECEKLARQQGLLTERLLLRLNTRIPGVSLHDDVSILPDRYHFNQSISLSLMKPGTLAAKTAITTFVIPPTPYGCLHAAGSTAHAKRTDAIINVAEKLTVFLNRYFATC